METIVPAVTVALYGGIGLVVLVALRRGDFATVVNGIVSFVVALLPLLLELVGPALAGMDIETGPALPLWLAVAGLLHSYGMLGPYDTVPWWDTLTHTISAGLLAAIIYAGLLTSVATTDLLGVSAASVGSLTVVFTFIAGIFWELIELVARDVGERFDVEPVLVNYGWRDTAVDLIVDVAAAVAVVLLDVQLFLPLAEQAPGTTTQLLLAGGAVVIGGSVLLTAVILR